MTRCSICSLPPERLQVIDEALKAGMPLAALARTTGHSKSSLHRHSSRHLKLAPAGGPLQAASGIASTPIAIASHGLKPTAQMCGPTKEDLIERVEMLWHESLDGLTASKALVYLRKPDGSVAEIPGDLRARCSFVRAAGDLVRMSGEFTGALGRNEGGSGITLNIEISGTPMAQVSQAEPAGLLTVIDLEDDGRYR